MERAAGGLEGLDGAELRAIAALWKRTRREVTARFTGVSMEPTLRSGAEVVLRCDDEISVGDVIAFVRDGGLVVHRIVALSADARWLLTCGDRNVVPDPLTGRDQIVGRIVGIPGASGPIPLPRSPRPSLGKRVAIGSSACALRFGRRPATITVRAVRLTHRVMRIPKRVLWRLRRSVPPS